jgi:hypothetical protein
MPFKAMILMGALLAGQSAYAGFFDSFKEQLGSVIEQPSDKESTTSLSTGEINDGLKEALRVGTKHAIEQLGREDGYFGNALVKIPVPEELSLIENGLRKVGMGKYVDDFVLSLNRAAEKAVPETASIFADAITQMSMEDVRQILNGPDDAATEYFRKTSSPALREAILPIVKRYTDETQVTTYYKTMVSAYDSYAAPLVEKSGLGGLLGTQGQTGEKPAYSAKDLDGYITAKGVEGLFSVVAEEEKKIRTDASARTTELLAKVFGSL